jgi:hypothetical protein
VRWALAVLSLWVAAPAMAAVAPEVSVEELARDADAVVRGTVTSATPRWAPDGRHIHTRVSLRRLSTWRGAPASEIAVDVPGGTVGDVAQVVSGAPSFQDGEEVVVFLRAAGAGRWRVLGLALGKFRVEGGIAVPQLAGLRLERAPLRSSERRVEAMPVDELERRVRAR